MGPANSPELSPRSAITPQPNQVVLLEHHVTADDDFDRAARDVFALVKTAQIRHPGDFRRLVITIDGHRGERAGFDPDFFEFQQEFMLGAMGPFLTWIRMPLTGEMANSEPQQDDPGDALRVTRPVPDEAG